jgi:hypothetical protein
MRLGFQQLLSIGLTVVATVSLSAQTSTTGSASSSTTDARSVERIRDALSALRDQPPLVDPNRRPPEFKVTVEEGLAIEKYLKFEDPKLPPPPAGGIYAYELQRQFNDPVNNPLTQPYAAFSGSEFATLAIEGVVGYLLGSRIASAISSADRERAEAAARTEVARAIAAYCASRPKPSSSSPSPSELCQALAESPAK